MENDGPIMDGTSKLELPEEVIHKIFSFLSRKDAIRASALSRQWRSAWISYSVFFFDINAVPFKNEDFFNYVDTSLALWRDRCDNQINMERLWLHTHIADGGCVYRLNQVLATAASRAVKAIELYNRELEPLTVPDTCSLLPVLFTCNLLRTLSLGRFEFHIPNSLSLPVMSSLSTLYLRSMIIDKDSLENLLSRFPSLRYLALRFCIGFHELRVSCPNLRTMVVSVGKDWPQKFLIDAANLQHFSYYRMSDPPDSVSFLNCKSLSSLCIGCNFNTAWAIDEFLSQLPLLENLTLNNSDSRMARKSIQISHTNLKSLTFNGRWSLSETEINTPNLRFFRYRGRIFHFSTFRYCSGYLDAKLHLLDGSSLCSGWFWFIKLRNFLESFSNCRVLTLFCNLAGFPEEFRNTDFFPDPSNEITHLVITNKYLPIAEFSSFVGAMVELFPCVGTLSVTTFSTEIFIKFDENRSFSLVWEAITGTSNTNEEDTLFQYIKAAVDEIEKQLGLKVEKIRMEQKLCIRNLS